MKRIFVILLLAATAIGIVCSLYAAMVPTGPYAELEIKLAPLATKLSRPQPGEWLYHHKEPGQTFSEYVLASPVRRDAKRHTIYLCLLGEFTPDQQRVMDLTREYMEIYFDSPVKIHRRVPLSDVPDRVRRKHPQWGVAQILTSYVLDEVLLPTRPDDALAYVAFTSSDLWPGEGWNFVFGMASMQERIGVWSIQRYGDPSETKDAFRLCLSRTLGVGTHETGHILTMHHCTAYLCNMNGGNSLAEMDRHPLHLCPVCLRKLCWNLNLEPVKYLTRLRDFCIKHGLESEADWYRRALAALDK
jgi:archaemetzincin